VLPLVLLIGGVLATQSARADITYNLVNYTTGDDSNGNVFQNGNTVAGTITTDGNTSISQSDIVSWTLVINGITYKSTDAGASTSLQGNLQATSTDLNLPYGGSNPAPVFLGLFSGGSAFIEWEWQINPGNSGINPFNYSGFGENPNQWDNELYGSATATNTNWLVANGGTPTGPGSVAPEPSTALVTAFGAVAFCAYGWCRRRQQQRRQAAA
jgi:hypothetical protein